jgi:hypothetical protein
MDQHELKALVTAVPYFEAYLALQNAARILLRDHSPDWMCSSETCWAAWLELEKAAGVVPSVLAPQEVAARAMLARIHRHGEEHGDT